MAAMVLHGAAAAQGSDEAAKAAARAVGAAGQAAARAVARDTGQPLNVPGYEGTDLAEADHTATGMDAAAQRALADPNDAGGAVGRTVVDGTLSRPDVDLSATDPEIRRADAVQTSPNAPAWRADGLASGSVRECGADLDDAGRGWAVRRRDVLRGRGVRASGHAGQHGVRVRGHAAQHGDGNGRR